MNLSENISISAYYSLSIPNAGRTMAKQLSNSSESCTLYNKIRKLITQVNISRKKNILITKIF